ncbi:MAG: amino acid ABC transporter permease [Dehalococcoidaceae bacterium]|nr:amino acid ABC transporter permease [Dehalococcoidaceae bacterium]
MIVNGNFVIKDFFFKTNKRKNNTLQGVYVIFLGFFLFYLFIKASKLELGFDFLTNEAGFALANQWLTDYTPTNTRIDAYITGVFNTVRLVIVGILFATLLGVIIGIARLSSNWLLRKIATVYVEVIRNLPLLLQIIFWWSFTLALPTIKEYINLFDLVLISNRGIALPTILFFENGTVIDFVRPVVTVAENTVVQYTAGFIISTEFLAILLGLVIYTASFIAEIVRGAIQALPKGQTEAAQALGFSNFQSLKLIILPQALRIIIPPITNQYLNLTKNSSLAVVIGYSDLFLVSGIIMNKAGHAIPMFIIIILTYQSMSFLISIIMNYFNNKVALVGNR